MFSLGLKGILIASVASSLLGLGGGWWIRDAFCDAAKARAEVAALRNRINSITTSLASDSQQALSDADQLSRLEKLINDLKSKINSPDAVCFSVDESDSLRRIWD